MPQDNSSKKRLKSCKCFEVFGNEHLGSAAADACNEWMHDFAVKKRSEQQTLLIDWIRCTDDSDTPQQSKFNKQMFKAPHMLADFNAGQDDSLMHLCAHYSCRHAVQEVVDCRKVTWDTLKEHIEASTVPSHANIGNKHSHQASLE